MTRFIPGGQGDNRLPGLPPDRRSEVSKEGREPIYVPMANPKEIHDHFKRLIQEEAKKLGEPTPVERDLAERFRKQEKAKEEAFETGQYLANVPYLSRQQNLGPQTNLIRHEKALRSGRVPRQSYHRPTVLDKARYFLDEDEREMAESQLYNSQVQPLDRSYQYDINGPLPDYVPYQPTHGPGNVVKSLNAVALRRSKGFRPIVSKKDKERLVKAEKKSGQKFKEDKAFRNPENYPSSKALKGYKRKKRVPDITDEALRFLDEDEREKMEGRGRRKRALRKK